MAYRRSKGKGRMKIEPMITTLRFPNQSVAGGGGSSTLFIDLMQCSSLLNRKFLRQGLNVAVGGFKFLTSTGVPANRAEGSVIVSKIPNTWVMANAWNKGFASWQRMNNEALDGNESVRPRFLDFKIFADVEHHQAGYSANLLPMSGTGIVATPGMWESSKISHPVAAGATEGATIEEEIIAVGPSYPGVAASGFNAVSLIEGYAASRGLPQVRDPNAPADADDTVNATPENWMTAMFNEGTEQTTDVLEDMITENNIAPYPFENDGVHTDTMYPGGANQLTGLEYHSLEFITSSTVGGTTRVKGGAFPCGLVRLDIINSGELEFEIAIEIELVPGTHRGLLCEPMQEMN